MDYRVDPKGKIFTTHVTKRNLAVIISVGTTAIRGKVYLLGDNRLKDELNDGETFIAVTDVRIYPLGSETLLYETPTLIVNKAQIAWILPEEQTQATEDAND